VIEWRRFEALVEALFAQAGFETKSQSHGADEGIDIWLYSRSSPGAPISIVQCKHWQGKKIGVDKVRELRGVMAAKNVSRGQFATTSTFTDEAAAFARDNGVNLLDVQGLLALIAKRTPEQQTALLSVALEGEYWRPTCVNCGVKMIERTPRKGGRPFWGCTGYPRCKNIMQLRAA
jgi:restriction system protein